MITIEQHNNPDYYVDLDGHLVPAWNYIYPSTCKCGSRIMYDKGTIYCQNKEHIWFGFVMPMEEWGEHKVVTRLEAQEREYEKE
jgi:hypothetical protein